MIIKLARRYLKETYTIGALFIDGLWVCDTIEDRVRDLNRDGDLEDNGEQKVSRLTAIPYGTYQVELSMSPKFTRLLPLVKGVPHFTGIRIHRGNTADDSSGCILPGENKQPGRVINSTEYEMKIITLILGAVSRGERITLVIT